MANSPSPTADSPGPRPRLPGSLMIFLVLAIIASFASWGAKNYFEGQLEYRQTSQPGAKPPEKVVILGTKVLPRSWFAGAVGGVGQATSPDPTQAQSAMATNARARRNRLIASLLVFGGVLASLLGIAEGVSRRSTVATVVGGLAGLVLGATFGGLAGLVEAMTWSRVTEIAGWQESQWQWLARSLTQTTRLMIAHATMWSTLFVGIALTVGLPSLSIRAMALNTVNALVAAIAVSLAYPVIVDSFFQDSPQSGVPINSSSVLLWFLLAGSFAALLIGHNSLHLAKKAEQAASS